MSKTKVCVNGGGKYMVDVKRDKDETTKAETLVLVITSSDMAAEVTFTFEKVEELTGFINAVTRAAVEHVAKEGR